MMKMLLTTFNKALVNATHRDVTPVLTTRVLDNTTYHNSTIEQQPIITHTSRGEGRDSLTIMRNHIDVNRLVLQSSSIRIGLL